MSPDDFINDTITRGGAIGIDNMDANQRLVWLISEAEVLCDMEGIDTFLRRYPNWLGETSFAFRTIEATDIANALDMIHPAMAPEDPALGLANEMISSRTGYTYEFIRRVIERRLSVTQS